MLIHNLDCLQSINGCEVTGGARPSSALVLNYRNRNLSIRLGERVLFEGETELPGSISVTLEDVPYLYASSRTETMNGIVRSTVTISSEPLDQFPTLSDFLSIF
jgi:hypothetical protein